MKFLSVKVIDVKLDKVVKHPKTNEDCFEVWYSDKYKSIIPVEVFYRLFDQHKYVPLDEDDLKFLTR